MIKPSSLLWVIWYDVTTWSDVRTLSRPEERKKLKVWNLFDLVHTKPLYKNSCYTALAFLDCVRPVPDHHRTSGWPWYRYKGPRILLFVCQMMKLFDIQNFQNSKLIINEVDLTIFVFWTVPVPGSLTIQLWMIENKLQIKEVSLTAVGIL